MTTENTAQPPSGIAAIEPEKIRELDVRPILRSGGEPFSEIMGAIAGIPADGALKLRATFKPTPLFHVLGKQGWQHWIEHGDGDDWVVWFYRAEAGVPEKKASRGEIGVAFLQKDHPELQTRLKVEGNAWYLDVRRMSPPEPMELTLAVVEKLPAGTSLVQINERIPQFLFPILLERGFRYQIVQNTEAEVRIEIGRAS